MKINDKSLAQFANTKQVPDMEGWLFKRGEVNKAYQKRWCTLRGNLLFYSEKKNDKDPLGVIILEGCTVELAEEETEHFAFKLVFQTCRTGRMYVLGTSSQLELEKWMRLLACASFDFMRLMVGDLKHKIRELDTQQIVVRGEDIDITHATRHNPFNAATNTTKQTKSWTDLHAQIGKQIKEDREQWLRILASKQLLQEPQQENVQAQHEGLQELGGGDQVEMSGDKLLVVL